MSRIPLLLLVLAAACGDNLSAGDAGTGIDAEGTGGDGGDGPDADPSSACDHDEADDAANDQAIEDTGATVTASNPAVICGQVDARAPVDGLIDDDFYAFELGAAATLKVTVRNGDPGAVDVIGAIYTNPFGTEAQDFGFLGGVGLVAGGPSLFTAPACLNHPACNTVELPAGTYTLILEGAGDAAPAAAIPYEVTIEAYDVDADCVTPGAADFTEARDMVGGNPNDDSIQNDVFGPATGLPVTAADDAPEASGASLTIAPAMAYLASGAATDHPTVGDMYLDRDVYEITTGATTNALDIKVTWTGAAADDFDWMLALPAAVDPLTTPPTFVGNAGTVLNPELGVVAVEPSTTYWLWVGAYNGTAADLAYDVTVCGSQITP